MAITGLAKSGKFSSDRTIAQYCNEIWNIQPVPTPMPIVESSNANHQFNEVRVEEFEEPVVKKDLEKPQEAQAPVEAKKTESQVQKVEEQP